jgi:hypothetical protein
LREKGDTGAVAIVELTAAWRPAAEFLGNAVDRPINAYFVTTNSSYIPLTKWFPAASSMLQNIT